MREEEVRAPIYKLIEQLNDGEWTDMVTAGYGHAGRPLTQLDHSKKKRIFHSLPPARAYRDKLRKQGRRVELVVYRGVSMHYD